MLEKPPLSDEKIVSALCGAYGFATARLTFLQLGNDSSGWVYQVDVENGEKAFLKVKKQGTVDSAAIAIPHFLKTQGLGQVVAVIPTQNGSLWQPLGRFALLLYPFIEGTSGMDLELTEAHWVEYGLFLKNLHATQLPGELLAKLRRETFVPQPQWVDAIRKIQALVRADGFENPHEQELAIFWRAHSDEIERIVAHATAMGRKLQARSCEFVLCHADIHTANLLIDAAGKIFVVDWDGLLLAPRERDLMFIGGARLAGEKETLFFKGYGKMEIDWLVLAYYRAEWVVQELGDYGERVFLMEAAGAETKAAAVQGLVRMFAPGEVVAEVDESARYLD